MAQQVFGLTGGIASGKSTVSNIFREAAVAIVDADVIAREVVEPGTPGLQQLIVSFGSDILDPDGRLNRKKLGMKAFGNLDAMARLHDALGGRIRDGINQRIEQYLDERYPLVCVDAALLVEFGLHKRFRPLIVVATHREDQIKRMMKRDGLSLEDAEKRLAAQAPLQEKLDVADIVIWNDNDQATLRDRSLRALADIILAQTRGEVYVGPHGRRDETT